MFKGTNMHLIINFVLGNDNTIYSTKVPEILTHCLIELNSNFTPATSIFKHINVHNKICIEIDIFKMVLQIN